MSHIHRPAAVLCAVWRFRVIEMFYSPLGVAFMWSRAAKVSVEYTKTPTPLWSCSSTSCLLLHYSLSAEEARLSLCCRRFLRLSGHTCHEENSPALGEAVLFTTRPRRPTVLKASAKRLWNGGDAIEARQGNKQKKMLPRLRFKIGLGPFACIMTIRLAVCVCVVWIKEVCF